MSASVLNTMYSTRDTGLVVNCFRTIDRKNTYTPKKRDMSYTMSSPPLQLERRALRDGFSGLTVASRFLDRILPDDGDLSAKDLSAKHGSVRPDFYTHSLASLDELFERTVLLTLDASPSLASTTRLAGELVDSAV